MLFIPLIALHDRWMNLQQMRYVLAVAETGSFTRAAQRCFVVQSALSHQIATLERELGLKLFARSSRRVELTTAGRAFLPAARQTLDAADRAVTEAAAAVGEVRGRLTIGVIPTVTAIDIPSVLRDFHREHPRVKVSLRVGRSDELVKGVRSGNMDLALLGLPDGETPQGVASRVLARDHHVVVVARGHPLATHTKLRMDELTEETFADFSAGAPGRAQTDHAFREAGLRREVAFESTTVELILGLVRERLAVALLPSALAPALSGLAMIPVDNGPTRTEHLVWDEFNTAPAATAFLELLRSRDTTA